MAGLVPAICAFYWRGAAAATGGIARLQFVSPRFQRSMSNCILAASSGGILRFSVLTTV